MKYEIWINGNFYDETNDFEVAKEEAKRLIGTDIVENVKPRNEVKNVGDCYIRFIKPLEVVICKGSSFSRIKIQNVS